MLGRVRSLLAGQMAKSSPTPDPSELAKLACSCCPRGAGRGAISDRAVKGTKISGAVYNWTGSVSPCPGLPRAASPLPGSQAAPASSRRGAPSSPLGSRPPGHRPRPSRRRCPARRPPCGSAHRRLRPPGSELGAPAARATLPLGGTEQLCS